MPVNGVTQPPISLAIIGACGLVYLLVNVMGNPDLWRFVDRYLVLWPLSTGLTLPTQLITYGFLHGSFGHLFFNMFAVWMFGLQIEQAWGSKRFVNYYVVCLLSAGVTQLAVQHLTGSQVPTIGASGAVFGLLLAYGVMYPDNKIFLIFLPIPIKAKWFVLLYAAAELIFGLTRTNSGIAHFAHLGGLFGGAALLWYWGWRPGMTWKR